MILKTSRVILRRPEPADAEKIFEYRNDPEVVQYLGGFSPAMANKSVHEWIEFHRNRNDEIVWAIADKETSICLGHVGLYKIDYRLQLAEFAICIGLRQSWGKGLGREVVSEVIAYAFNELHMQQIRLEVLETNQRAIHLYEGLGFQHDGRLRCNQFRDGQYIDSLIMSLLKSEWKSSPE
jgi:ribosomal-protein-alanine N-acetyltransferase